MCSCWSIYGTDVTTLGHLSPGSAPNQDWCCTSAPISFSRVRLLQGRTTVDCGQQQLTLELRRITTCWIQIPPRYSHCTGLFWPLKKLECTADWVKTTSFILKCFIKQRLYEQNSTSILALVAKLPLMFKKKPWRKMNQQRFINWKCSQNFKKRKSFIMLVEA